MSKRRPLRVINEYGTPVAVHAGPETVYELHGPKARIVGYDDGGEYEGVSVERLHLRATNPERAAELDRKDEEKAEADRQKALAAQKAEEEAEAKRKADEAARQKAEAEAERSATTTTTTTAPPK